MNKVLDTPNVWLAIIDDSVTHDDYSITFTGNVSTFQTISNGDWLLVADKHEQTIAVAKIYRKHTTLDDITFYFDKLLTLETPTSLSSANILRPTSSRVGRLQWADFCEALPKLCGKTIADIPLIENHAYVRELFQLAVTDDLLGPANGPNELIIDMGVRDRYLVGKFAPMEIVRGGIEGLEGPTALDEEEEEYADMDVHTGSHDTGAEFESTTGRVEAEIEATDEIDATNNQSLVPSSFGITFCVDGDVERIQVEALWGRYERVYDHEYTKKINKKLKDDDGEYILDKDGSIQTEETELKVKVWQRVPCGGKINIEMKEGVISHLAPDSTSPEVRIQGTVRDKNEKGDRLVTLFLVNAQEEPETNKDTVWIFQPELIITGADETHGNPIFRRRPVLEDKEADPERSSLEMIYRNHVEFAVGHGISVHAIPANEDLERAIEIRTKVLPDYEVPVTETPGLKPEDRPAMREMIDKGYLDMQVLADMEKQELVDALTILANDYAVWIDEQSTRIGSDVIGYDDQAKDAVSKCQIIHNRLLEGIDVLSKDEVALKAFRFANSAMALQRIRSMYALSQRRNEDKTPADLDKRQNRSWRPFQLAFVLLSIPSIADPLHADRTKPVDAFADLLWFPTGGGKTEAYLGVAAFTMVIRRLHGKVGGYDGSRGLGVIMRYTLRLLTLQQFQRGSTLLCAMEVLRREALARDDESYGSSPFTIGLWVGNKVTPGTSAESSAAITAVRDPNQRDPSSSPAQITSCPWCGSEVAPGRDIEVRTSEKRTLIYCGDNRGRCDFSRGRSATQPHPGIPVLVVDEEIYHRPPSMMIATVDKFAMMAWRGQVRTLFGRSTQECPRHGLLWPDADCAGTHRASRGLPAVKTQIVLPIRPPDLIIQDEFHLISGPLGTMVGLYETAVDELCSWQLEDKRIRPKIVASTATVRKAVDQVRGVFMRQVSVFPPHGLDIEDNFFSVQRSIEQQPGRRYMGICSPGSSRPAVLIRVYTALLTAASALFDRFGQIADPYMTTVGYFNSLRELGGMKRLAEDDVQTRSYRVQMSMVKRPGLGQRSISNIKELTSRVSSQDIPKYLDQLEVKFKAEYDAEKGKYITKWDEGELRAIDVVLATNMLSVGVDVNRLGLMAVNGQPKGTAEYIQSTSRVGRQFPGLVCTVLTWARPRDLSHYETFEHYHATFYKHVEAQSVTPFSPRAMDRGMTGAMMSLMRLENNELNPNDGAGELKVTTHSEAENAIKVFSDRAWHIVNTAAKDLSIIEMKERIDEWVNEANEGGRNLAYEKRGQQRATTVALIKSPGFKSWDNLTVPMSMREVEPGVRLQMFTNKSTVAGPNWAAKKVQDDNDGDES